MQYTISNEIGRSHIEAIAAFLKNLGAHMNIYFVIKVKILALIKWSHMSFNFVDHWAYDGYHILGM